MRMCSVTPKLITARETLEGDSREIFDLIGSAETVIFLILTVRFHHFAEFTISGKIGSLGEIASER